MHWVSTTSLISVGYNVAMRSLDLTFYFVKIYIDFGTSCDTQANEAWKKLVSWQSSERMAAILLFANVTMFLGFHIMPNDWKTTESHRYSWCFPCGGLYNRSKQPHLGSKEYNSLMAILPRCCVKMSKEYHVHYRYSFMHQMAAGKIRCF